MNLLAPLGLLFALLALPILLLYMLKLRRKEVQVSSSMLWQMVLRDRQANAPWQKLRRNLLLFLQLLILALLVLALARPAIPTPSVASGPVIVIIDASASMNATDAEPTRFEAALDATRQLINSLETGSKMTIIAAGGRPQVLASAMQEPSDLRSALEQAQLTQGPADWSAAFALANGAASAAGQDSQPTIVIISDGGLPTEGLPPLPGEVRYIAVGSSGNNLAISALSIRQAGDSAELFARVDNYGPSPAAAVLSFYTDDILMQAEAVEVAPGGHETVILPGLPNQAALYRASLEAPGGSSQPLDVFSLDNTAFAVYQPPAERRVLLVTGGSSGNIFLEQVLAAIPGVTPFRALPAEDGSVRIPEDPFDVYVFDGYLPEVLPAGDLLIVNPPSNPLFQVGGTFTDTANLTVETSSITEFADLSEIQVRQARQVDVPDWGRVLVRTDGGPLLFAGETAGRRVAVLTFDLHDSDLPLRVAFPVLFSNLMDYLAPAQAFDSGDGLQPGEPIVIRPDPGVTEVAIAAPDNQVYASALGEQGVLFTETGILGLYAVNYLTPDNQWSDFFAVNLFDPQESIVMPAAQLQIGRTQVEPAEEDQLGQREFWPWLAAAALLVLIVEWIIYHRRQTVSGWFDRFARRPSRP